LADTSILNITGDKAIIDLNIIHVFNYLSMTQEIKLDEWRQKQIAQGKRIL
jgi:hypothetical protein